MLSGKYGNSWLQSLDNVFSNTKEMIIHEKQIAYAVSFATGPAVKLGKLMNISNEINIDLVEKHNNQLLENF